MASSVDEEALHQLYLWVDNIPLSRPKRNLSRDFSDGVLVAEVIKFYFPKMVEMHNYVPANSLQQKLSNWSHLNRKVLNKLNFSVPDDVMRKIAQCAPGVVELVLIPLRQRLEERQRRRKQGAGSLQELAPQDGSGYMDVGKVAFLFLPPRRSFLLFSFLTPARVGGGGGGEAGGWDSRMLTPPLALPQVYPRRPEVKVPRTPREGCSSGRACHPRPSLPGIARRCRATQASSSRSLKRNRSCWPRRRPCRSCR
ncbi:sperm flagellar protein 1 isoform X2 [Lemur catta]|uniref:sperm flagellar protein 1 isoform X2 n=1 Tax=Lemur catta TaxID=9447 RepID=UPI001E26D5C6|nr:sperm flagellar protein 1 isoform X2 [Lemur catta]